MLGAGAGLSLAWLGAVHTSGHSGTHTHTVLSHTLLHLNVSYSANTSEADNTFIQIITDKTLGLRGEINIC